MKRKQWYVTTPMNGKMLTSITYEDRVFPVSLRTRTSGELEVMPNNREMDKEKGIESEILAEGGQQK